MTGVRDRLKTRAAELLHADGGATAIEYALLTALIAGALVVTLSSLGSSLTGTYSNISAALNLAQAGDPGAGGGGGPGANGKGGNGKGNNGNGKGNGGPNRGG